MTNLLPEKREVKYLKFPIYMRYVSSIEKIGIQRYKDDLRNQGHNSAVDLCRLSFVEGLEGMMRTRCGCGMGIDCEHNELLDTIIKSLNK